jgi:hypothetical protein
LAEQAKQAQGTRTDLKQESNIPEKIQESEDSLDPETAATIAVEMGDQVKSRQERETAHKVAKTMGTNQDYVRKAKKIQEHAPDHHRD